MENEESKNKSSEVGSSNRYPQRYDVQNTDNIIEQALMLLLNVENKCLQVQDRMNMKTPARSLHQPLSCAVRYEVEQSAKLNIQINSAVNALKRVCYDLGEFRTSELAQMCRVEISELRK